MFKAHRICRAAMIIALVGCAAARPNLRTPMPETIAAPPEDDVRYSQPVEYPKELLNRPPVKPQAPGMPGVGGGPKGPSMGSGGMGAY